MKVRLVNETEPLGTVEIEVEHVPRIGEKIVIRGQVRLVHDVITTVSVTRVTSTPAVQSVVVLTCNWLGALPTARTEGSARC